MTITKGVKGAVTRKSPGLVDLKQRYQISVSSPHLPAFLLDLCFADFAIERIERRANRRNSVELQRQNSDLLCPRPPFHSDRWRLATILCSGHKLLGMPLEGRTR